MLYIYKDMNEKKISLVISALRLYGTKGVQGPENNPVILSFFDKTGKIKVNDDETPWCSAFLNGIANDLGFKKSGLLNARSWLNVGVGVTSPSLGDIVIFWRESPTSWKGHVAIYIKEDSNYIWCLGGNQNNEVNISKFEKSKVLGYRDIAI